MLTFAEVAERGRSRRQHTSNAPAIGVSTTPGCTVLTRMFFSPSEVALYRISPTTPCLAA
jgi:hypothetical protein